MDATYLGDIELTDETLEHYGVKGMKWKYHKPKASPNNSAAYNQLAAMKDDEYQALLKRIKLTKSSKGKSASSKTKGSGKKAAEKKTSSGKASSTGKSSSSDPTKSADASTEAKKNTKREEEEVNVEIKQPNDILDKIRKNYKPKKIFARS